MLRAPTHLEGYCDGMAGRPAQMRDSDEAYYDGYMDGAMDRARLSPPTQLELDIT